MIGWDWRMGSIVSVSSASAFSTSILSAFSTSFLSAFSVVFSSGPIFPWLSPLPSFSITVLPSLLAFTFSLFPGFFGEEVGLNFEGSVIAWVFELLCSWISCESHFKDSQKSLLSDCKQTLFLWLPDINNFSFTDVDDLVKTLDLTTDDL